MSSIAFSIFEEYSQNGTNRKFTPATDRNCVWMRIYVWTKDKIDLVQELNILNSLLVKHGAEGNRVFKVCIDHLLLPEKAFIFFCVKRKKKKNEH